MFDTTLFSAETIRLTALDAKEDAPAVAAWTQDSRTISLMDQAPPRPMSAAQAEKMLGELLKEADEKGSSFWFGVRTVDESELLGITGLEWVDWSNGAGFMKLAMKNLAEYGRPSAAETLALMQQYAFHELQLHRLNLIVPAYHEGLITAVQKKGFIEEVRQREAVYRFGRRWDLLRFGLAAAEWAGGRDREAND